MGRALCSSTQTAFDCVAASRAQVDVTRGSDVREFVASVRPRLIINCAAYTAVDLAESEVEKAQAVNVHAARHVAEAANAVGARLIHISTDFVFDGSSLRPYRPDDPTNPLSVYGRTKLLGEESALEVTSGSAIVLRTAWLYGSVGQNFVTTMLRLMASRSVVSVVDDQTGTPTWTGSLAEAVWALAVKPDLSGIHHWVDGGTATWFQFAECIYEIASEIGVINNTVSIRPISTSEYPTAARRPAYSVLDCSYTQETVHRVPEDWRHNLREMMLEDRH